MQACDLVGLSRPAYYRSTLDPIDRDAPIINPLLALVAEKTRWGFWKCWHRLRAMKHAWNHKRVYRVYCTLRPNQARRTTKRALTRVSVPLNAASEAWRVMYNTERPHQSLGDAPPSTYLPRNTNPSLSNYKLCARRGSL